MCKGRFYIITTDNVLHETKAPYKEQIKNPAADKVEAARSYTAAAAVEEETGPASPLGEDHTGREHPGIGIKGRAEHRGTT